MSILLTNFFSPVSLPSLSFLYYLLPANIPQTRQPPIFVRCHFRRLTKIYLRSTLPWFPPHSLDPTASHRANAKMRRVVAVSLADFGVCFPNCRSGLRLPWLVCLRLYLLAFRGISIFLPPFSCIRGSIGSWSGGVGGKQCFG